MMSRKRSVVSLPEESSRKANDEMASLECDLLKMIHVLRRERVALDNAILTLERVKRDRLAIVGAKSRKSLIGSRELSTSCRRRPLTSVASSSAGAAIVSDPREARHFWSGDPKPENETTDKLSLALGCGPLDESQAGQDAEKR